MKETANALNPRWRYALVLKCPTCGKEKLFKSNPYVLNNMLDMNARCSNCGEDFQVETGFYYGAMYMSYIITCALCLVLLPVYMALNFSRDKFLDNAGYYIASCALLIVLAAPYVAQLSRAIWLTIHIKYMKKHDH